LLLYTDIRYAWKAVGSRLWPPAPERNRMLHLRLVGLGAACMLIRLGREGWVTILQSNLGFAFAGSNLVDAYLFGYSSCAKC
jgi:hypothetical protein